ncbi:MAG: pyridoxamine 5'-phosphate oxidase [Phycisphaerales bacterium]
MGILDMATSGERTLPEPLPADPMPTLISWFDEAHRRAQQPNPNAMTLATVDPDGRPSARIVLCKSIDAGAGFLVFHTNYRSRKGRALSANPRAAVVFHWDALDLQARIEGVVVKSPSEESDAYFQTRAIERRVGAWASDQSEPIESREALEQKVADAVARFGVTEVVEGTAAIPRPPHWGGYRVYADRVELWVAGSGRLHDRARWERRLSAAGATGFVGGPWSATRLQP